jgi:hypothetical protein
MRNRKVLASVSHADGKVDIIKLEEKERRISNKIEAQINLL